MFKLHLYTDTGNKIQLSACVKLSPQARVDVQDYNGNDNLHCISMESHAGRATMTVGDPMYEKQHCPTWHKMT
jgi:hypothetical protein